MEENYLYRVFRRAYQVLKRWQVDKRSCCIREETYTPSHVDISSKVRDKASTVVPL